MSAARLPSSAESPLPLRSRSDLQAEPQVFHGHESWLVRDPVSLKYFRFSPEDYFILTLLDGKQSAESIRTRFAQRFAPQRLTAHDLQLVIGQLFRSGLLLSDRPGQGIRLHERTLEQRWKRDLQRWSNPLALRFRGVDPEPLLKWLQPWTAWCFSFSAIMSTVAIACLALILVTVNFEEFQSRLPGMRDFFAGSNWLSLAIVLALTKVLHELGHALACRRFGGECHELGLMLLVFTPCLYANVTDSYRIPEKWKRITISAAGIYVELTLASLATLVWWSTHPGLLNQLALNVMFICSVGTLLFNANPLMKYDGYYILADWLELPNLRSRASKLATQTMSNWLLGLPTSPDPFLRPSQSWVLWTYALAATLYRYLLTIGIGWFLYELLEPAGLRIVAQAFIAMLIAGLVLPPIRSLYRFFSTPGRWTSVNRPRLAWTGIAACGLTALVLFLPLPYEVRCAAYLQPAKAREVYVESPGIVTEVLAQPGETVSAGQPLLRLASLDLDRELARLEGELKATSAHLKLLQTWSSTDEAIAAQVPAAQAAFVSAESQVIRRRLQAADLTITAPISGKLLPPPPRPPAKENSSHLPSWEGQPLAPNRPGCYLESETHLGTINPDSQHFEAVLLVTQDQAEPISAGQPVKLWINQLPGQVFSARTGVPSAQPVEAIPAALALKHGGSIPSLPDGLHREVPETPLYQLAAPLDASQPLALNGATGIAHVRAGNRSLAFRLWRWFLQTFHFPA